MSLLRIISCVGLIALLVSSAHAGSKPAATVPATQEIEVLDPNVHPTGQATPIPRIDDDGRTRIEIPPVVLVHRYYYTGDRSFQGPFIPGGPSMVVVTHPKSGERLYLPLMLPPGAPRVTYTHNSIEYDYGPQSTRLVFSHCGDPRVVYRQGKNVSEKAIECVAKIGDGAKKLYHRTDLPKAIDKGKETAKNVGLNTVDRANGLVKTAVTPVKKIASSLPGVSMLTSPPKNQADLERGLRESRSKPIDPTILIPR